MRSPGVFRSIRAGVEIQVQPTTTVASCDQKDFCVDQGHLPGRPATHPRSAQSTGTSARMGLLVEIGFG